ncbi:MAG: PBSX family phage terminase large subunit [Coriobacteriia bacterium]|nr:PBSX family phage terminase large subunit [Coriobacteriia bacterium]
MVRKLNPSAFNDWVFESLTDYTFRIEAYVGGAGSGKSYGATQKMLLKALKSKRNVLVIRKIQRTIKHSIWALMLSHLRASGFLAYCRINRSDYEIELPNGSVFLFKGLDDEEKIKSIEGITDIIIEEATELTEDEFTQLNLRLRAQCEYPQLYLMFNPVSKKNWVYGYFFEGYLPENAKVIHTTYRDNRFLSDDYVAELEALQYRNPAYYRIYTLGEFATLGTLVFPNYETRLITDAELEGLPFWIGLDFGYVNDPSAIVWGRINEPARRIYVTGDYVKRGMLNDEIAEIMTGLALHKDKSYADSAEPKSIAEIRRLGVNIEATVKGKDSVINGIQWLLQHELIVDERCSDVIGELENYTWKRDRRTGEYMNEPVDTYNHTIDAIRYGLNRYIKGTLKPLVVSKSDIGLAPDTTRRSYWR